jgi:hypothetical protein
MGGVTIKPWMRPELVVLVRGKPEEYVLAACKTLGIEGPNIIFSGCALAFGGNCGECQTHANS